MTGFDARPLERSTTRNRFAPSCPLSTQVSNVPPLTLAVTGNADQPPSKRWTVSVDPLPPA